ncbi:MAG: response regulator, partial [Planctomycetaceae bacterium]|nr:response regulator [Planctomycetaceae bacterium]
SVIEAHGGRLTAASAGTGRGSTFTLELAALPRPTLAPAPPPPPPAGPAPPRALRILLVEDNKETLKFLVAILGRRHTVRPAADLSSALGLAAGEEFDLVLSDIELPDGSGLELMQELRKTRDTPGIAMSGFGSEEDVRASRSAGFAEHLTKPINYRTLEEAIQRVGARCEGAAAAR